MKRDYNSGRSRIVEVVGALLALCAIGSLFLFMLLWALSNFYTWADSWTVTAFYAGLIFVILLIVWEAATR
jgi:hypothetical protein